MMKMSMVGFGIGCSNIYSLMFKCKVLSRRKEVVFGVLYMRKNWRRVIVFFMINNYVINWFKGKFLKNSGIRMDIILIMLNIVL